jgi:hypothetical protein
MQGSLCGKSLVIIDISYSLTVDAPFQTMSNLATFRSNQFAFVHGDMGTFGFLGAFLHNDWCVRVYAFHFKPLSISPV